MDEIPLVVFNQKTLLESHGIYDDEETNMQLGLCLRASTKFLATFIVGGSFKGMSLNVNKTFGKQIDEYDFDLPFAHEDFPKGDLEEQAKIFGAFRDDLSFSTGQRLEALGDRAIWVVQDWVGMGFTDANKAAFRITIPEESSAHYANLGATVFEGIDKEIYKLGETQNVGAVIGVGGRLKDENGNPTDKVIMHYVAVVRVTFENPHTKKKDTCSYFFDANTGVWGFIENRNFGNSLKAYFERIYDKWTHEYLISIPMSSQNCQQLTSGQSELSNGLNAQKLWEMRRAMNSTPQLFQYLNESAPKLTLLKLNEYLLNIKQRILHLTYCLNWPTAEKQKMIAREDHPKVMRLITELAKTLSFLNECIKIRERATLEIRQQISGDKIFAALMQSNSAQKMIRGLVKDNIIIEQISTEQNNVEQKILAANSAILETMENVNHRDNFLSELQKLIETQKENIQSDIKKRYQNQPRDVDHMVDILMEDSQSEVRRRAENSVREILLDKVISNGLHQERIRALVQKRVQEKKAIASNAQSTTAKQTQNAHAEIGQGRSDKVDINQQEHKSAIHQTVETHQEAHDEYKTPLKKPCDKQREVISRPKQLPVQEGKSSQQEQINSENPLEDFDLSMPSYTMGHIQKKLAKFMKDKPFILKRVKDGMITSLRVTYLSDTTIKGGVVIVTTSSPNQSHQEHVALTETEFQKGKFKGTTLHDIRNSEGPLTLDVHDVNRKRSVISTPSRGGGGRSGNE